MRVSHTCRCLVGILVMFSVTANAQESDRQTPARDPEPRRVERETTPPQPQPVENIAGRRSALERLALTGTLVPTRVEDRGPDLEVVWRNEARENLTKLATGLQALYDLGAWKERDAELRRQIDEESRNSGQAARQVLEFINRGTDPPESEAVELGTETFDERVLRLAQLYLSVLEPIAELIDGDILDLEQLDQARSGLLEIEALSLSLSGMEGGDETATRPD